MESRLTKGPITQSLLLFALPMILGNLLQQLYNIADTFIVGKYIGSQALAAVGSSFTMMTFLTSIILGLCMGSSVLFSMLYGAHQTSQMKTAFFVSFISIALLSLILEGLCLYFIEPILYFINIPQDIFIETKAYLWIIFLGLFFTFLYNYFSSLLRAIGNSRIPLYFLALSTLINIILDIIFIVPLHLGVQGAALATIIAQALSALGYYGLCMFVSKRFASS